MIVLHAVDGALDGVWSVRDDGNIECGKLVIANGNVVGGNVGLSKGTAEF